MMKQVLALVVLFAAAITTGFCRFGVWKSNPPIWLDITFLVSTAAFVVALIAILLRRMHSSAQETIQNQAKSLRKIDDRDP